MVGEFVGVGRWAARMGGPYCLSLVVQFTYFAFTTWYKYCPDGLNCMEDISSPPEAALSFYKAKDVVPAPQAGADHPSKRLSPWHLHMFLHIQCILANVAIQFTLNVTIYIHGIFWSDFQYQIHKR